jgi:hypothetical protein
MESGGAMSHPSSILLQEGKTRRQVWVLFCAESAARYPLMLDAEFLSRFDLVVASTPTADLHFSYMPSNTSLFASPIVPKTELAVWIASNCVESRLGRVARLISALEDAAGRGDDLHRFGSCLHNRDWSSEDGRLPLYGSAKLRLLQRYKFTIAYENSHAQGYVTEKFYQPLIAGSVPVYWGAPDITSFAPNSNSYIDASKYKSEAELAEYLLYLDRNDTAYAELLDWKVEAASGRFEATFSAAAASSSIVGPYYGEAAHHCGHKCQWLFDPGPLNELIRAKLSPTGGGIAQALPANRVGDGVLGTDEAVWWLPVHAGVDSLHLIRLSPSTNATAVVRRYCKELSCDSSPDLPKQLHAGIENSMRAVQDDLREELRRGSMHNGRSTLRCELHSRPEGFFSNVLAAVDGLLACEARGIPASVVWNESDFPYRSTQQGASAWEQFFQPLQALEACDATKTEQIAVSVRHGYSMYPAQVPTQFERWPSARLVSAAPSTTDRWPIRTCLEWPEFSQIVKCRCTDRITSTGQLSPPLTGTALQQPCTGSGWCHNRSSRPQCRHMWPRNLSTVRAQDRRT